MKRLFSTLLILGACSLQVMRPAHADALYDRVIKSGKIRASYATYPPLLIRDPNTKKFSGIGYDVLELAAKRLGLKLEMTEEVTWGTMIEGLRTNRYDIIACPVWANATRARAADFSKPLCYSAIYAYTKAGDKRLDASLKDLNSPKYKVATIDGEMADMIASMDYPKTKRFSLPQMADASGLLLSVSTGKADITFTEPSLYYFFSKHNPNAVQNITPQKPLRIFPNVFMFNVGEEKFKCMLNTAIDEISNSGELDRIITKYEPHPKDYLRLAAPYRK